MGQPGWMVRSPGDLGSVAPGPVSKNRSQPLHQPLRISKGWREELWVRGGKEWGVIMEEIGVLGESETPSGDLLGYRNS